MRWLANVVVLVYFLFFAFFVSFFRIGFSISFRIFPSFRFEAQGRKVLCSQHVLAHCLAVSVSTKFFSSIHIERDSEVRIHEYMHVCILEIENPFMFGVIEFLESISNRWYHKNAH